MSRIKPESALPALKSLGHLWSWSYTCDQRTYWEMETPSGKKLVKVVPRPYDVIQRNGVGRYYMGISIPLFGVVDEWAFYFEGERWLYIVPDATLFAAYTNGPRLKGKNHQEWIFNFAPRTIPSQTFCKC